MRGLKQYYTTFFFFLFFLALQKSNCASVVVDGVSQWKDPTASIGDTIIFKHKNQYNLYIFRTKDAFNSCNFTQATPLSKPNSTTYTWHPSRAGDFYFAFYNGTNIPCQQGEKLSISITTTTVSSPSQSPPPDIPPPATPGGVVSSSPSYPWPFQPREKEGASPGPAYTDVGISPMPAVSPAAGSIPFINSNPAVPLPTGEVDSATIRPLPTSADHDQASQGVKIVGFIKGLISLCYVIIITAMIF